MGAAPSSGWSGSRGRWRRTARSMAAHAPIAPSESARAGLRAGRTLGRHRPLRCLRARGDLATLLSPLSESKRVRCSRRYQCVELPAKPGTGSRRARPRSRGRRWRPDQLSSDLLRQVERARRTIDELRILVQDLQYTGAERGHLAQVWALIAQAREAIGPLQSKFPPTSDAAVEPRASKPPPHRPVGAFSSSPIFPKWVLVGAAGRPADSRSRTSAGIRSGGPPPWFPPVGADCRRGCLPHRASEAGRRTIAKTAHQPAPQPAAAGKPMWRVIAHLPDARRRSSRRRTRSAGAGILSRVFQQRKKGYYWSLGGRMTREDALRRQRRRVRRWRAISTFRTT